MIGKNKHLIASTMVYRSCPLEVALYKLKEHGFDKIELCTVDKWVPHYDLLNSTEETMEKVACMTKDMGLEIVNINVSGIGNVDDDNNIIETAKTAMLNALKLAKRLGTGIVTTACGTIKPENNRGKRLEAISRFNNELVEAAIKDGIKFSIEAPHKLSIAEKSPEIAEYWRLQDERIWCTFDIAHMVYAAQNPIELAKTYINRVALVHLRDATVGNSLLHFGKGDVDFAAVIDVFKNNGYEGYFSIEFPCETERDADEFIKNSINFFDKYDI